MSAPLVVTGYEPTGQGWELVHDQVFAKAPAGTQVVSGFQDFQVLTALGKSLIGNYLTMQQLHDELSAKGFYIYYMGGWNNPPSYFGIGIDSYRITWVRKA